MTKPYQEDLSIANSSEDTNKNTLKLTTTGDISVITGQQKLAAQMMRAIISDDNSQLFGLNSLSTNSRNINTLTTLIYRDFKQTQIEETNNNEESLTGFHLYRREIGLNGELQKITTVPVTWKYTDTNVENGKTYEYGLTRFLNGSYESIVIERLQTTPTSISQSQNTAIGQLFSIVPGNGQVSLYVDYNRYFLGTELLDEIVDIITTRDPSEPRRYTVEVVVNTLSGSQVSFGASRYKVT